MSVTKCTCGHSKCSDYWPSNGSFCQGSGYSKMLAYKVDAAEDMYEALEELVNGFEFEDPIMNKSAIKNAESVLAIARGET